MFTGSADQGGEPGARPRVLLVVEDDEEMRALLCEVLAAHGFEPHGAVNDSQALLALKDLRVDAVVLDNNLPGLSGLEILPGIRCLFPEVPVILVSAFGDARMEVRARERGAAAFLPKPFRMADLVKLLHRHMLPAACRT